MDDHVSEVSYQSWGQRLGGSLFFVLLGLALFGGAFPLIWWNEERALQTSRSLDEARRAAVALTEPRVDRSREGRLVHIVGPTEVTGVATDDLTRFAAPVLRIERTVEMLQWKESWRTKSVRTPGGGKATRTVYSYRKVWSESVIDSSSFRHEAGHRNPARKPAKSGMAWSGRARIGAFTLASDFVRRIGEEETVTPTARMVAALPGSLRGRAHLDGDYIFLGADPDDPQIGDARIRLVAYMPGMASAMGAQKGDRLEPWTAPSGDVLVLADDGEKSVEDLVSWAEWVNVAKTWGVRAGAVFMMWIGFNLMLQPLAVLADVIPFFGDIVRWIGGVIAFGVASVVGLTTIGGGLIVAGVFVGCAMVIVRALRPPRADGVDASRRERRSPPR